jgi:hypothetical protein
LIQTLLTPMLNGSRRGTGGGRAFPNSVLDVRRCRSPYPLIFLRFGFAFDQEFPEVSAIYLTRL